MPILSNNRYGMMGTRVIEANESYKIGDMGRILYEDARNDMALFNAVVRSDMREIAARNEGSLLESELTALTEGSVRDFFSSLKEKVKKIWAKIKGYIKSAIAKLGAYFVRDGKKFAKIYRTRLGKVKNDTDLGHVWIPKSEKIISLELKYDDISMNRNGIGGRGASTTRITEDSAEDEVRNSIFKGFCSSYDDDDDFYTCIKEANFNEVTKADVSDVGGVGKIKSYLSTIENGKSALKSLKNTENKIDKHFRSLVKELDKEERAIERRDYDNGGNTNTERDGYTAGTKALDQSNLEANRIWVNANSYCYSTAIKAEIRLYKFGLGEMKKIVARACGNAYKVESTLLEAMVLEAEEVDLEDADKGLTAQQEEEVQELVKDTIEELANDSDDSDDED